MSERSDALRGYLADTIAGYDPEQASTVHDYYVVPARDASNLASTFGAGTDPDTGDRLFRGWSVQLHGRPMEEEGRLDAGNERVLKRYTGRLWYYASVSYAGDNEKTVWNHVEAVTDHINETPRPEGVADLGDIRRITAQLSPGAVDTFDFAGTFAHVAQVEFEAVFEVRTR